MEGEQIPANGNSKKAKALEDGDIIIPEPIRPIFDKLPPEDRKTVMMFMRAEMSIKHSFRKAPLPDPEELALYNNAAPDGANRIMIMVEKQSAHRIQIEDHAIREQLRQSSGGQTKALIIALVCLTFSFLLAWHGNNAIAGLLGGSTILGLTTIFITGRNAQKKDLRNKK